VVETQIAVVEMSVGDGPHQRERERAADWLIAHGDRSYPRVLAHVDAGRASPALIEILPRFGRTESLGRLARLMAGPEPNAWAAGQALAQHHQLAAGEALRRALAGPSIPVAIIAADALGTRADRADCPVLVAGTRAHDVRLRYHTLQAGAKLGCFRRAALESLARSDADAEVRSLAAGLAERDP
jgi:HEAT repeat protein